MTITFRKNRLKSSALVFSVLSLSFSNIAISGAWVPSVGAGYAKIGYSNYQSSDFFGGSGSEFSGQNMSFYGELGVAKNIAVYGTLLYQRLEQTTNENVSTQSSGLGDAELGLKVQWLEQPLVVSTSFLAKLPYLYDKNGVLPRGNGQEDYEFRLLAGRSLNKYGYLGAEAGYRFRTGSASDEYRLLLEYGFSVNDNMYLRTKLDSIISADNGNTINNNANLSMTPAFDLTKVELTAGWTFNNANSSKYTWGTEVTYRRDLAGENTLKGHALEIGLTSVF